MSEKIKYISSEKMEIIERNQVEILELKNTISKMKRFTESLNRMLDITEEIIQIDAQKEND